MPRKSNKKEVEVKEATVIESPLEDILADRFGRYSKYIIQERALPDARDGLKPVQRRILYAMMEDGNAWNKSYRKSAKTVGNVIGNYHPHGDSSVYDAMVRLSQDWKIRWPLIDMQGNNGSIDDDPAAAMRYTEARLSKISSFLLEDIEKDTVEWTPNFSDEKMEPVVFPSRYPNLLVNGISGIAAGYATYIPPHNLNEVIEGTIYRIQHPKCSLDNMMNIIKGPDFPTGGIIMSKEGIRSAFETGKGKVLVRGKAQISEEKTLNQIVITEIPYEVVKSNMVKKMDEIRLSHKVEGILDVRDESDRNGLRIVVDLKKEVNPQAVLNYFYKNTELQVSCNYNTVAIVNKAPRQMPLLDMLDAFIDHRVEVVTRRCQYELAGKEKRAHIVEGLIQAVSVLDEVISIIRQSKNKSDSKQNLMNRFSFSETQAEAIVMLQLYRLSNTDIEELQQESERLKEEISELRSILESNKKLRQVLVKELKEVNKTFETPRLSSIEDEIQEIVIDQKAIVADEQVMITVSRDGYLKRVSLRSYSSSNGMLTGQKETDEIIGFGQTSTLNSLAIITNQGKYGEVPIFKIEEARWKEIGSHISSHLKLDSQEKIIAAWIKPDDVNSYRLVFVTKQGLTKRFDPTSLSAQKGTRTQTIMNLASEDQLIQAVLSWSNEDELIVATKKGVGLRLQVDTIPQQQGRTKGVRMISLGNEDEVVQSRLAEKEYLLLAMEEGYMKRIAKNEIPLLKRGAKGSRLFKEVKASPAHVKEAFMVNGSDELMLEREKLEPLKAAAIPIMATSTSWSRVLNPQEVPVFSKPLETIHSGTWKNQDQEDDEQLSLFKEESK